MPKPVLVLAAAALMVLCGDIAAGAQENPGGQMMQRPSQQQAQPRMDQEDPGVMGQGSMMGPGMMGPGVMGQGSMMGPGSGMGPRGMMGHGMMRGAPMMGGMGQGGMTSGMMSGMMAPVMMRMMFSLMDGDGDGTISLQEFQAAHERIFKGMDSNKDGRLTLDEIRAFMHARTSAPQP